MVSIKRTTYKGYIIDTDSLGRLYIYNTASPYSEDSDHIIVNARTVADAKTIIDNRIAEATAWGGARPGAGRPATGRKRASYYVTLAEHDAIKKLIDNMRKNPAE